MRIVLLFLSLVICGMVQAQGVGQVPPIAVADSFFETNADTSADGDFIRFFNEGVNTAAPAPSGFTVGGPGLHIHHEKFGVLRDSYIYGSFGSLGVETDNFLVHGAGGPGASYMRFNAANFQASLLIGGHKKEFYLSPAGAIYRENVDSTVRGMSYYADYSDEYLAAGNDNILASIKMVKDIVSGSIGAPSTFTETNADTSASGNFIRFYNAENPAVPPPSSATNATLNTPGLHFGHRQFGPYDAWIYSSFGSLRLESTRSVIHGSGGITSTRLDVSETAGVTASWGTDDKYWTLNDSGLVYGEDFSNVKGMRYGGDYSSFLFLDGSKRIIPDIGMVETMISDSLAGAGGGGTSESYDDTESSPFIETVHLVDKSQGSVLSWPNGNTLHITPTVLPAGSKVTRFTAPFSSADDRDLEFVVAEHTGGNNFEIAYLSPTVSSTTTGVIAYDLPEPFEIPQSGTYHFGVRVTAAAAKSLEYVNAGAAVNDGVFGGWFKNSLGALNVGGTVNANAHTLRSGLFVHAHLAEPRESKFVETGALPVRPDNLENDLNKFDFNDEGAAANFGSDNIIVPVGATTSTGGYVTKVRLETWNEITSGDRTVQIATFDNIGTGADGSEMLAYVALSGTYVVNEEGVHEVILDEALPIPAGGYVGVMCVSPTSDRLRYVNTNGSSEPSRGSFSIDPDDEQEPIKGNYAQTAANLGFSFNIVPTVVTDLVVSATSVNAPGGVAGLDENSQLNETVQLPTNPWVGKRIMWVGTSIPASFGEDSYPNRTARWLGASIENVALSSSYITANGGLGLMGNNGFDYTVRVLGRTGDDIPDVIVIDHLVNDLLNFNTNAMSGTSASTDPESLWGAFNTLLPLIYAEYPGVKVVIASPSSVYERNATTHTKAIFAAGVERLREIAKFHAVPFVDYAYESGINQFNYSYWKSDGLHPTEEEAERAALYFANKFLSGIH